MTLQPDITLVIRRPAEPDAQADRRLRFALKSLLRRHGLRVVSLAVVKPGPDAERVTPTGDAEGSATP